MKWNLLIGLTILASSCLAPADAEAARTRRAPVEVVETGYQNKPIARDSTVWYCAYDGKQGISCRLGDPGEQSTRIPEQVDPRLPELVHGIRNTPAQLAGKSISIPLHATPFDFEMVGKLAEAVMCGSRKDCGVVFGRSANELASLVVSFEQQRLAAGQAKNAVGPFAAAN